MSKYLMTSTLFIGDLSINCDEESIYRLFSSYGEIDIIELKRSDRDPQRVHLGFGFIKFTTTEAAERALHALNGYFFLGRSIRVGWAEDHDSRTNRRLKGSHSQPSISDLRSADPKKNRQTAQIHVTFSSCEMNERISELELGNIFGQFGNLVDIAIKKNVINPDHRTQSGYAFIHYALTEEGIRSAVMAVERTNYCTYDHITFQSKVTHSLQVHIFALKRRASGSAILPSSYKPQSPPVISPLGYDNSFLRFDSYEKPAQYYSAEPSSTIEIDRSSSNSSLDSYQSPFDLSYNLPTMNKAPFDW